MTDTAFYDGMDALATSLLNKFGSAATLRKFTIGEVGADGKATKTPTDYPGLAVKTEHAAIRDMLNTEVEAAFVFKGPQPPEHEWQLIYAGTTWKINAVKLVSPEGNRIIVCFIGVVKP